MLERPIDPPENLYCEECGRSFYPGINQVSYLLFKWRENETVICFECTTFLLKNGSIVLKDMLLKKEYWYFKANDD